MTSDGSCYTDMTNCSICPRACGAARTQTSGGGYCGMGCRARVARAALHLWEEPCLSGTRGSGAVFFSGCNLRCAFCQNAKISHGGYGADVTALELADIFRRLSDSGAHNINLVNPTHFAFVISDALELCAPTVPVVWNSGGYDSVDTLRRLSGAVSVFLPDMKYSSPELSGLLSGCPDYFCVASEAIAYMREATGPAVYDADGLMTRGTIVRHLVLPGHIDDTRRVLEWFAKLPETPLSLMAQYTPCGDLGKYPELCRTLSREEYDAAVDMLTELGIDDGWVQELSAASGEFIPAFDLTGVR